MIGRNRHYRPSVWARLFLQEAWKLTLSPAAPGHIRLISGGEYDLHCLDVNSIVVSKGLLWHTVELRSKGRTDRLSGLNTETAHRLQQDLLSFINRHLSALIDADKEQLREVDLRIRGMTDDQRQYLSQ